MEVLKVKKLSELGKLPTKSKQGDAAFDIYASVNVFIPHGSEKIIPTDIAIEIPEGYYGQLQTRSGMASSGLDVRGGVIDSNFRGEIGVILHNSTNKSVEDWMWGYRVTAGDRVAQLVLHKLPEFVVEEVGSLSETNRGLDAYGSTGK